MVRIFERGSGGNILGCAIVVTGRVGLVLLLACALAPSAAALDPNRALTQYALEWWDLDKGLPQNTILAITQTSDGHIWFGTQEGLVRFDGSRMVVFDRTSLGDSYVRALCADPDGSLWIGTEGGRLAHYRAGRFEVLSQPGKPVRAILRDHDGVLWIGTSQGGGLLRYVNGTFTALTTKDGLTDNTILSLYEDRDGALWIGTRQGGLVRRVGSQFSALTTRDGLSSDAVAALCEDGKGGLWIGTFGGGLNHLSGGRIEILGTESSLPDNRVISLLRDRQGNVWAGTSERGLVRLSGGALSAFASRENPTIRGVHSLFEDREGSLWVGTATGGLCKFRDGTIIPFASEEGLPDDSVWGVHADRSGAVWIATGSHGVVEYRDGRFTDWNVRRGLASDAAISIYEDRAGALWFGTNGGGLSCLRGGRITPVRMSDGPADQVVTAICEEEDGTLWVGTAGTGLYRLKSGKFTVFGPDSGFASRIVFAVITDRRGDVWSGTSGAGLVRYSNGQFTSFAEKDGLLSNRVLTIYADRENTIWCGTDGGGLVRCKDGKLGVVTSEQGLFVNNVLQILEDDFGRMWMNTNKGIFWVRKSEVAELLSGTRSRIKSYSYDRADGMKNIEGNGGFQPAGCKSRDGRLWFPTLKGLVVVDPAHLRLNDQPPPVVIEDVVVDGKSVLAGGDLRLPPGTEKLELHYAGLSYANSKRVAFKYQLEGYEESWVDAGSRRVAYYTRLRPGPYRFVVIACNEDGVWNTTGATQSLILLPRFYQTRLFAGFIALLTIGAGWGLHLLRANSIRARFRAILADRARIAREIHDSLSQCLTGISIQLHGIAQTMQGDPEAARRHMDLASHLVRNGLAESRLVVWDLRPHALEDRDLSRALEDLARLATSGTGIEVMVKSEGSIIPLPARVEAAMLRIGQESITNAVKHARCHSVHVTVSHSSNAVSLRVRDDGCGFDAVHGRGPESGHFGLAGMRERAEQLGGTLSISSAPGDGTEVGVILPLGR
ncbi:MAG: hypothetical protein HYX75_05660 [Acidobacteria bacterium]|nr:hypothetical protein [Acidobacteriota bacterium]